MKKVKITKQQLNEMQSRLTEKLVLKDFDKKYIHLIADAYDLLPSYDESAVKHWHALNAANHNFWRKVKSRVKVIFVSGEQKYMNHPSTITIAGQEHELQFLKGGQPYETAAEMSQKVNDSGIMYISMDYSDHPVFSVEDNVVFRSVHDYIVHIQGGYDFGAKGEIGSYNLHAKLAPADAVPALFTEVVGQAGYAVARGEFPEQKIATMDDFDFYQVGKVKGYDVKDKELAQQDAETPVEEEIYFEVDEKKKINEAPISKYRDPKHFKGANIQYPDLIFADITNERQANVAINFYKKIMLLFNKMFKRNMTVTAKNLGNDFNVVVTYEGGLTPEYYAYPEGEAGGHVIQTYINKDVPATSLRHELFHEIFVPLVLYYFDLINNLDGSAVADSIEDVQRDRVNNYRLDDIFFERLVEYLERNPDFKDTFPMSDFMIDVVNRIKNSFKEDKEIDKEDVLIMLNNILHLEDKTATPFLKKSLPALFHKADFTNIHTVSDLDSLVEPLGKKFEYMFNMEKNMLSKEVEFKTHQFQQLFLEEYYGTIKKLRKLA